MSLNANAIVTLAKGKTFLSEESEANDTVIETMINSISMQIEAETARKVIQQTLTSYRINGSGGSSIIVPYAPLKSVSSILSKSDYDDSTLETFTSYSIVNAKTGRILLTNGGTFPCGVENIVITMSVGYASTDPELAVFEQATLLQLKNNYKRWENQEIGLVSRTLPDGSVSLAPPRGLLLEVLEMIRPYEIIRPV